MFCLQCYFQWIILWIAVSDFPPFEIVLESTRTSHYLNTVGILTNPSKNQMLDRVNKQRSTLAYSTGDYENLHKEPTGQGKKFKFKYSGPYFIQKVNSPHMLTLKDPLTQKCLPCPVHIDRSKQTFVRKPNPSKYFMYTVQSKTTDQTVSILESDSLSSETPTQDSVSVIASDTTRLTIEIPLRRTKLSQWTVQHELYANQLDSEIVHSQTSLLKLTIPCNSKFRCFWRGNSKWRIALFDPFCWRATLTSKRVTDDNLDPKTKRMIKSRPLPHIL